MGKRGKKYQEAASKVDRSAKIDFNEAVQIALDSAYGKFDETVEMNFNLGIDAKKTDQMIRGNVSLPHGTGKSVNVCVICKGEDETKAQKAGADTVGSEELITKIAGGWTDFDAVIATPDMMREVGKLGKVLGPRGLMPAPKAGTVTTDVKKAVEDLKKGKIEFKVDKNGVVNNFVGKLSFSKEQLVENIESLIGAISKMKPPTAKGNFMRSLFVSSTMGAGLKIELNSLSLS